MNQFYRTNLGLSVALLLLTASCVDDNYDLSDIDSTVKVDVNNFTVPVNLDAITLKSLFNLKDDGIVKVIDGEYAVVQDGTFSSDNIHINDFTLHSPHIDQVNVTIPNPGNDIFPVTTPKAPFSTDTHDISSSILDIEAATTEATITFTNSIRGVSGSQATLSNAVYELPKGLTCTSPDGTYDSATGLFRVNRAIPLSHPVVIDMKGINIAQSGAKFNAANHSLLYEGSFALKSGEVTVTGDKFQSIDFTANFHLSDIKALTIDGDIEYKIDNMDVTDVDVENLPDILADEQTDITLDNPQIYMSVLNPLNDKNVYASFGMTITALRNNSPQKVFTPEPNLIKTGTDNKSGYYNFCLARQEATYPDYPGATFVPFPTLPKVFSGAGIPTTLSIVIDNPQFPAQHIKGLVLGQDLGEAEGRYTFFAPLKLKDGSRIVYADHVDGWGGEDMDDLTVTELNITAIANSDMPIDLDFTGYPIDEDGNQINGVTIEGAKIPAYARNLEVKIRITGEIRGLDGIRFRAVATAQGDEKSLTPEMNLHLSKLRPTVSGYYQKEL